MAAESVSAGAGCVVVGGGPAGVVPALLLAREVVRVSLLEAHDDFDRDFRGDTLLAGGPLVTGRAVSQRPARYRGWF